MVYNFVRQLQTYSSNRTNFISLPTSKWNIFLFFSVFFMKLFLFGSKIFVYFSRWSSSTPFEKVFLSGSLKNVRKKNDAIRKYVNDDDDDDIFEFVNRHMALCVLVNFSCTTLRKGKNSRKLWLLPVSIVYLSSYGKRLFLEYKFYHQFG